MKFYNSLLHTRLLLACISGAMVVPISFLENMNPILYADVSLSDAIIGSVFGILVMVPFQRRKNLVKSLLLIISSITIYVSMVNLAVNKYDLFSLNINLEWAITLSGGLGAVLTVIAVKLITFINLKNSVYPLLLILGLLSGYIFSLTIDSQSIFINALGFIIWQVTTCFGIAISKK